MIKKLTIGEAARFEDVPIDIYKLIINGDCMCFGDVNGSNTVSLAVFTASAINRTDVIMRYIGVDSKLRFRGNAGNLINYCKQEFIRGGAKGIYIKLNESMYELSGHNEFLISEHFIPVSTEGFSLYYTVGEMKNAPVIKQVLDNISAFPKTETIKDWGTDGLRPFLIRNRDKGLFLSRDSHDPRYSRIYRHDDLIKAAMFVASDGEDFIVNKIYLEELSYVKVIVPSLLAGFMKTIEDENPDKKVVINAYHEAFHRGIIALFGEPSKETKIYEYYLPFRRN